jgi:hypothetical protein
MEKNVKHDIRDHSEFGGSTAARRTACPGSAFLERMFPKPPASKAATEGTEFHEFAAVGLGEYLEHKEDGEITGVFEALCEEKPPAMVDAANDYIRTVWTKLLKSSITGKVWGIEDVFVFNKQLDMWGSIDFWAIYKNDKAQREGIVCDAKYGFVYVPAKKNAQLAFYACSLRNYARGLGKDLDIVRTAIFQPRLGEENAYREDVLTSKQLDVWEKKFMAAAHQIYVVKKPKFKVGDHCKYCAGLGVCKAYAKEIKAKTELSVIDVKSINLPAIETINDSQLRALALHGDLITTFIKGCKAHAINRYLNGRPVEGTKVVEVKGRRGWIKGDEIRMGKELKAQGVEKPWSYKLKGIGELEKALGKKKGILEQYIKVSPSRPVLVDASDNREAVVNYIGMFSDVSEESDE